MVTSEHMRYLKGHTTILVFYLLYVIYTIKFMINPIKDPRPDSGLPIVMFTFIFFMVAILNALFRKKDKSFYLVLAALIILQPILLSL